MLDFRFLDEGIGGTRNKRKRDDEQESLIAMDVDHLPPSKRAALPSITNPDKPIFDGVRVSGRKWKQPRLRRASAQKVSHNPVSFEVRAKQKEIKKAYTERKNELKEEIRANKVEKRKKKVEREKKKEENILRSGTKLQKITNPKTLMKISKSKMKKQLKVVPDNMFDNKNKKKSI
ncbi:hypothetical protein GIB67_018886 [Kingdonia uniflora]|uniref:Coiled-coil domain-containing protein 86 n=1 Tax=Kingdonia uniflora TaxID=39325 RepID=A0A7J7MZ12_9MAGN|nr:hypothetical protein GIB67_018886 [Kingdonia uniflora]